MNSLTDLKEAFIRNGTARIVAFNGYELKTDIGLFELCDGQYYIKCQAISKKALNELTKHGILS
jgi:hypothetical protein